MHLDTFTPSEAQVVILIVGGFLIQVPFLWKYMEIFRRLVLQSSHKWREGRNGRCEYSPSFYGSHKKEILLLAFKLEDGSFSKRRKKRRRVVNENSTELRVFWSISCKFYSISNFIPAYQTQEKDSKNLLLG